MTAHPFRLLLCHSLPPPIIINACFHSESQVHCIIVMEWIWGVLLLKKALKLLVRKTRRLPIWNMHIIMWLWRSQTKRLLQRQIHKSCYFLENFYTGLILLSVPGLKTLGYEIPKIVSLFEPVKLLMANTDNHELCQSEELSEAEFDGLGEDEITQLKQR